MPTSAPPTMGHSAGGLGRDGKLKDLAGNIQWYVVLQIRVTLAHHVQAHVCSSVHPSIPLSLQWELH